MKIKHILLQIIMILVLGQLIASSLMMARNLPDPYATSSKAMTVDTIPVKDRMGDFITDKTYNPFDIATKEVEQKVEYDPKTNQYVIYEKVGGQFVRTPTYLTFEEYLAYSAADQEKRYFNALAGIKSDKKSRLGRIDPMDKIDLGNTLVDRLFGGTEVNIQPQGTVDLSVGWLYSKTDSPALRGRGRQSQPDFPTPVIKMNVDGKIGKKLDLGFNYDTQSNFDFDRIIKLGFDSQSFSEDDIIKKIEAGNVSLPLRGNLIQGAQSLMGLKTELQFGRLRITALASQQRSKNNNIKIENGESVEEFTVNAAEYDENKHFFISHYNRDNYEDALDSLPFINSSHQIAQMEVWISDDRIDYQENTAMIAAISDLGEPNKDKFTSDPLNTVFNPPIKDEDGADLPRNGANTIYQRVIGKKDIEDIDKISSIMTSEFKMKRVRDFEIFRGRKLSSAEYTYHPKLGTITVNSKLRPNQVLGVAYNYFYTTICDSVFQVGMIAASAIQPANQTDTTRVEPPKVHFVKLIKSSNQSPFIFNDKKQKVKSPQWDLMMKNGYSIRSSTLNPKDFVFDIYYEDDFDDGSVKKFIPDQRLTNVPILQLVNLDKLNRYNDPQPDGYFDYIPGVTVIERSGSIIIPILEPFGKNMSVDKFKSIDQGINASDTTIQRTIDNLYKYQELYDSTITQARLKVEKNKFSMRGKVKQSGNNGEYPLGPFVPQGSVRVTAGSKLLIENQDYEIDYGAGRLRIINEAYLQSGTPINISFEDNSAFSLQQKRMLGLRAEYQFNKKSALGFTYLKLYEIPFTLKVNIEDDPIKNRMLGFDYNFEHDLPKLTKFLDKLPFYSTAEKSKINLTSEVAVLLPDHANDINTTFDKTGIANIDDFEGAVNNFNLGGFATNLWTLASTPEILDSGEGKLTNDINVNSNRARFNWYSIDFGITKSAQDVDDPYTAQLSQTAFFPNRNTQPGQNVSFTFDLSFYPKERGPYNFDERIGTAYSGGFTTANDKIILNKPEERWGGIMRYFPNADFEAANYESIEFWMMDPFQKRRDGSHDPNEEGEIVFNLGSVSEDIMKDNLLFFENAIPTTQRRVPVTNTPFGRATVSIPLVSGFDLKDGKFQDLGFDALNDDDERSRYSSWLTDNQLNSISEVNIDPSNDNFTVFTDQAFIDEKNLLVKMKNFNGPQGNAPLNFSNNNQRFVQGNSYPDNEDLNNNRTLDQAEAYYEYKLKIKNNGGALDTLHPDFQKYFRQSKDVVMGTAGNTQIVKWYRIQIPIAKGTAINGISGFRSIQYMRMYMTKFSTAKTFRLLDFQLQRTQWRKLPVICDGNTPNSTVKFSIDDVGIEENSDKLPFNYIAPVQRTPVTSSFGTFQQDEKSLVLKFSDLGTGCEVSVNKLNEYNLALYKKLQLFVHAERAGTKHIPDKDLAIFVRIGKDYTNNYYEYELPLTMSKDSLGKAKDENVWPKNNYIDLPLDRFTALKKARLSTNGSSIVVVADTIDSNKGDVVRLKGNPSLGAVKTIVIGVRNLRKDSIYNGEVWINELRVTGFDEGAAFATESKIQLQLADLAEVNISGGYNTSGYGSLQDRLNERLREEVLHYDVATTIDAGKILPKALKLSVPVYAQYQKEIITPEYDPYDLDIKVREKLDIIKDEKRRAEVKETAREVVTIRTLNLTNVKTQAGNPKYPWSPSNVSATYGYTENIKSDPIIKQDKTTNQNLGLDYAFSIKSKYVEPLKFIKPKALKILSDFNFSPLPSTFTFTTRMNNLVNSRTFRLPTTPVYIFDDQRFNWERNYVLNWDLSRSLRLNFRANSTSIVDQIRQAGIAETAEGRGYVDEFGRNVTDSVTENPGYVNDYRNANLRKLGRSKNYDHNIGLNYKVPFKNIPYMEWVSATADYKADYAWNGGSLVKIDGREQPDKTIGTPIGNVIKNGQNIGLNVTLGFDRLYAKIPYLKAIETGKAARKAAKTRSTDSGPRRRDEQISVPGKDREMLQERAMDNQISEEVKKDRNGNEIPSKDGKSEDKKESKAKKEKEDKPRDPTIAERIVLRPLLLIRTVKFDYKEDRTTMVPGFMRQSSLLGLSEGFSEPGWGFAAGLQPRITGENNWLQKNQAWFNDSKNFNEALSQMKRQKLEMRATVEPFKDFNIDITMKRNYTENHTEVFRTKEVSSGMGKFTQMAQYDVGSFDATFMGLNTLFRPSENLYETFKTNREVISRRLPNQPNPGLHPSDPKYVEGYGPGSYLVNVPAFIAAYTNKSAYNIDLDQKKNISRDNYIPKPNWQLNYNGLSKLKPFKKVFSNISLKHGYLSTIRMNDFRTDAQYNQSRPFALASNGNYFSRFELSSVIIQEQFAPIIGLSIKTHKDMKIDVEYKKSRTLDLGILQLRESNNTEIAIGAGYVIKNVKTSKAKKKKPKKKLDGAEGDTAEDAKKNSKFPSLSLNKNKGVKKSQDLKFNVTYSLRDDLSQTYDLQTGVPGQADRGAKTIALNPTIEYDLNNNLSLRFYFDYSKSIPKTSFSFPTTTIRSGITFRFNIN